MSHFMNCRIACCSERCLPGLSAGTNNPPLPLHGLSSLPASSRSTKEEQNQQQLLLHELIALKVQKYHVYNTKRGVRQGPSWSTRRPCCLRQLQRATMPFLIQPVDWRQSVVLSQLRQALLHHLCNICTQDQDTREDNGNISGEDWC